MNVLTAAVLVCLLPLLLAAVRTVAIVGPTGRRVLLALIIAMIGVLGAALLRGGQPGRVEIISRSETFDSGTYGLLPRVRRHSRIIVAPCGTSIACGVLREPRIDRLTLEVSTRTYDRLRTGEIVPIRFFSLGPLQYARLADGGWREALPEPLLRELFSTIAWPLSWLAFLMLLVAPWLGGRSRLIAVLSLAIGAAGAQLLAHDVSLSVRSAVCEGEVVAVHGVDTAEIFTLFDQTNPRTEIRLASPYDEVRLRVPRPPSDGGPVEVLDRVDHDPAIHVGVGDRIRVAFAPGHERDARIIGRTRRFVWRNALTTYGALIAIVFILALASAVGSPLRRIIGRIRGKDVAVPPPPQH